MKKNNISHGSLTLLEVPGRWNHLRQSFKQSCCNLHLAMVCKAICETVSFYMIKNVFIVVINLQQHFLYLQNSIFVHESPFQYRFEHQEQTSASIKCNWFIQKLLTSNTFLWCLMLHTRFSSVGCSKHKKSHFHTKECLFLNLRVSCRQHLFFKFILRIAQLEFLIFFLILTQTSSRHEFFLFYTAKTNTKRGFFWFTFVLESKIRKLCSSSFFLSVENLRWWWRWINLAASVKKKVLFRFGIKIFWLLIY